MENVTKQILDFYIDLFCGAGGTSTGIENSGVGKVVYCINHDKNAILSHNLNHPEAVHTIEDIRTAALAPIIDIVRGLRADHPGCRIHIWASLECTNHSKAKGGTSRNADSRTLAEHLFRYIDAIDPDVIWIENVREFEDWCRLRIKSVDFPEYSQLVLNRPTKKNPIPEYTFVPDKRYKGEDYQKWIENVQAYGYNYDRKLVNTADHGFETSRDRLFIQFAKPWIKTSWAPKTHDKKGKEGFPLWKGVRPLLKLEDPGKSIFDMNLADNSLNRLYRGVKKFSGKEFMTKYYGKGHNAVSLDVPAPALTTKDRLYPIHCTFLMGEYGSVHNKSIDSPCPPIMANPKQRVVTSNFIVNQYTSGGDLNSIDGPMPAITTVPKSQVVTTNFLMDHAFKNPGNSVDAPCPTLIARQDKKPKYIVSADHYLMDTNFGNVGTSIDAPAPTIMACRKRNYLISFERSKTENSKFRIKRFSGSLNRLIRLMGKLSITDIKMRSLHIDEMLAIMGFPTKITGHTEDYKLVGTKTQQKKYIGNAVHAGLANRLITHHHYANSY